MHIYVHIKHLTKLKIELLKVLFDDYFQATPITSQTWGLPICKAMRIINELLYTQSHLQTLASSIYKK